LSSKVEVDRRLAEPGARRDVVQTGRGESLLDEQLQRRLEDLARPLGRRPLLFPDYHCYNLLVSYLWGGLCGETFRPLQQ
jgi:hypothetical protein